VEPGKELGYDSWLHWVAGAGPHTMKEKLAGLRRKEKKGRQALRIWPKGRFLALEKPSEFTNPFSNSKLF
jgi:hypothetical protein